MIQNRKKMLLCRPLPNLWMRCRRKSNSATDTMPPSEGLTRFTLRTSPKPTMRYKIRTRSKTVSGISNYGSRRANLALSLSPPWDRKRDARAENCYISLMLPKTVRMSWRTIWQNARATSRRTKKQAAKANETAKESIIRYRRTCRSTCAAACGKAGWSWGYVSAIDFDVRTIWIVDAHRDDGQRFIVRADEKLTAFLELERAVCIGLLSEQS